MINILILIASIHFVFAKVVAPDDITNWNVIQHGNIWIGWAEKTDIQWCRSISTLPYSINAVMGVIEDKKHYPEIFDRVEDVQIFENDIIHLMLDMPFPFSGRDYIVQYTFHKHGSNFAYRFQSVKDRRVPLQDEYVRLPNAAGEWYLQPTDDGYTQIRYTWNGELLGDFPNWALTRAWKEQGNEVIDWLDKALAKIE